MDPGDPYRARKGPERAKTTNCDGRVLTLEEFRDSRHVVADPHLPKNGHHRMNDREPVSHLPAIRLTYTVEEAANALGISRGLAYELVREGRLPALRMGQRRILIPVAALESMLTKLTAASR